MLCAKIQQDPTLLAYILEVRSPPPSFPGGFWCFRRKLLASILFLSRVRAS